MSNARRPENNEAAGAQGDTATVGKFMARRNTVRAETLARLLNGERLTGLDAVAGCSTTRLAAVVHALRTKYGWPIEGQDHDVGCRDGRVSEVAADPPVTSEHLGRLQRWRQRLHQERFRAAQSPAQTGTQGSTRSRAPQHRKGTCTPTSPPLARRPVSRRRP